MKILVAFPDTSYYNWQILVQINNFIKFGYANKIIYVVGKQQKKELSNQLKTILESTPVEYYVYDDERRVAKYPSSLRPHILAKFFEEHPKLNEETFFYVDPDLLFAKQVNFKTLLNNDTWYVSDTKSYLDSKYIKSKSEELFIFMCCRAKVNYKKVIENDSNAGGAQYLMKNLNTKYWKEVEDASERLYDLMKNTEQKYSPQHPIQSWTADMWAVLWTAWNHEKEVKIASRLSFSWATDNIDNYEKHNLFHNAGVVDHTNLFKKTSYQKSPFDADFLHVLKDSCSYKYVEEIEETKLNYPELIKLF